MSHPRLPYTRLAPETYKAMIALGETTAGSTLGPVLMELVRSRVSQINGCAFCVDMHSRELRAQGETWQRLNSLVTWREVEFYTPRERAALAWAESLTTISAGHAGLDAAYEPLAEQFSEREIVDLTWTIAQINTWNRMAVGMKAPVAAKPLE